MGGGGGCRRIYRQIDAKSKYNNYICLTAGFGPKTK